MKKVGIITLNGNFNIGNRLQNYALEQVLIKNGYNVETIWFTTKSNFLKLKLKKVAFKLLNYKKKNNFLAFSRNNLHIHYYFNKDINNYYDYFIAGSDQVWNYEFPDFDDYLLLTFSTREKNISYAASFGIEKLSNDMKPFFKEKLFNFSSISVREDAGKKIIDDLGIKIPVKVVLDPTMLLTKEDWENIARNPKKKPDNKYIFTYFLGENNNYSEFIKKYASDNNFIIVDLLDKESPYYDCGPCEFISLIKNANIIFTDSFHASVFSIIFNKPFIIFDRKDNGMTSMNSRLVSLVNNLNIKDRFFNGKDIKEKQLKIDYTKVNNTLSSLKNDSLEFLKKSISGEKYDR